MHVKNTKIGQFMCSHFNINNERKYTFLAYYALLLKKSKNSTEMQKVICAVYGDDAVTDWTCQKWFVKFCAGDFLLDIASQSGRPVQLDSYHIETLIENNQCYTTWEITDKIKCWKSFAPAWPTQ